MKKPATQSRPTTSSKPVTSVIPRGQANTGTHTSASKAPTTVVDFRGSANTSPPASASNTSAKITNPLNSNPKPGNSTSTIAKNTSRTEVDLRTAVNNTAGDPKSAKKVLYAEANWDDEEDSAWQTYRNGERNVAEYVVNQQWFEGVSGFRGEDAFRSWIIDQANELAIPLPSTFDRWGTYTLAAYINRELSGSTITFTADREAISRIIEDYLSYDPLTLQQHRQITTQNVDAFIAMLSNENPIPDQRGVDEFVRLSNAIAVYTGNETNEYLLQMNRILLGYPTSGDAGMVLSMADLGPAGASYRIADNGLHRDYVDYDESPHQISFHTWSYVATTASPSGVPILTDVLSEFGNVYHEFLNGGVYGTIMDYRASVVGMYLGRQIREGLLPSEVGSEFHRLFGGPFAQAFQEIRESGYVPYNG
ncbi:MAG: hypothetical protein IAE89_03120 [Anaerolineae bacterium]|nr:hypothetical protein [Anaerolineae bacterium]